MVLIAPGLGALALSSSEKITEFMGFFVMVGNVSTVIAPGIVALLLGVFGGLGTRAYRIAMSSFAVAMVLGTSSSCASQTPAPQTPARPP
jgi:MFS-type transporter involved in bile tolerance (Atg22 family)